MFFQAYRTMKTQACILALLLFGSFLTSSAQTRTDPKLIDKPYFELSNEAIAAGIEGRIVVSLKIGREGKPESAEVIAGPEWPCKSNPRRELDAVRKAAKEYALSMKFEPATENGKPASANMLVTIATGRAFDELKEKREREAAKASGRPFFLRVGVINGRAISLPKPEYPSGVRGNSVVEVAVLIGEDGKVERAGAYNGHPVFHSSARNAACKARFTPTKLKDSPIKVYGSIKYMFAGERP